MVHKNFPCTSPRSTRSSFFPSPPSTAPPGFQKILITYMSAQRPGVQVISRLDVKVEHTGLDRTWPPETEFRSNSSVPPRCSSTSARVCACGLGYIRTAAAAAMRENVCLASELLLLPARERSRPNKRLFSLL